MLCALVLGVLVMHHAMATDSGHTTSEHSAATVVSTHGSVVAQSEDGSQPPSGAHELLHLCLAILVGAFALVLAGLRREVIVDRFRPAHGRVGGSTPARDPPLACGRQILLTVCVLRV